MLQNYCVKMVSEPTTMIQTAKKTCFGHEIYIICFLPTRGKFCGAIFNEI